MSEPNNATPRGRNRAGSQGAGKGEPKDDFDALVRSHTLPLRQFLRRRVSDEAVDDVMQEVLVTTWSAWPGGAAANFPGLLYRVARFKVVDWFRSHSRRTERETDLPEQEPASPLDAFAQLDNRLLVAALVAKLSPPQQEVITLYYTDGLTLAEIAQHLGRGPSIVKYHFYRAHEEIARLWQEEAR